MSSYSIKDLEILSGVKAHTIRIWEQRYNLLIPDRTETNIRTYDDEQLKKLLRANVLYNNGYKISKIAAFSDQQLIKELEGLKVSTNSVEVVLESLTIAMIEMNESQFDSILKSKIKEHGIDYVMQTYIYPFFERIGVLWLTNVIQPAQEHFISNLLRQKIITAINEIGPCEKENAPICFAYLHEEEMHELGLLYYTYHLKLSGYNVVYLGQMLPYEDLLKSKKVHQPDVILTSFVKPMDEQWFDEYVQKLLNDFPETKIFACGYFASKISIENKNLFKIPSVNYLRELVS